MSVLFRVDLIQGLIHVYLNILLPLGVSIMEVSPPMLINTCGASQDLEDVLYTRSFAPEGSLVNSSDVSFTLGPPLLLNPNSIRIRACSC